MKYEREKAQWEEKMTQENKSERKYREEYYEDGVQGTTV